MSLLTMQERERDELQIEMPAQKAARRPRDEYEISHSAPLLSSPFPGSMDHMDHASFISSDDVDEGQSCSLLGKNNQPLAMSSQ